MIGRTLATCLLAVAVTMTRWLPWDRALGAEQPATGAEPVLESHSYWRTFLVFRPMLLAEKAEGATVPEGEPRTAPPADDWTSPDFDDSKWCRTTGPLFSGRDGQGYGVVRTGGGTCGSEQTSLICLRGRFAVADPAGVKSLTLSAVYRGGLAVWVNGTEVARAHLAAGKLTPETPGQEYPPEAFFASSGAPLDPFDRKMSDADRKRLDSRLRRLDNVSVPPTALRKGVNVVAIAVYRAPVNPQSRVKGGKSEPWLTAGLESVRLEAAPAGSVECNTRRPKGTQVWNESPFADVYDLDYGDPNEPLRPIELVGVRHGSFSGQVAVGSDAPIRGLSVRASDLSAKGGGAAIPAAAVRITYPIADGAGGQEGRVFLEGSSRGRPRFDALAESALAEVPLATVKPANDHPELTAVPGAVQPVRITVEVPADAAAGDYEGALSIKADGMTEVSVPVKLTVYAWTLPDRCDFTSVLGVVQSAESLAVKYDVPLWSEKHWQLIDHSFSLLARAGADVVFMPLVMKNHHGREAMVRWVKNDDGTYSHDFSLFEKYLDTAMKHIKRPELVTLYVWDRAYRVNPGRTERLKGTADSYVPPPVVVPLLDKKTGEVGEMEGPPYNDPKAVEFWKPVLDGCHERLKQRGIADRNILLGVVPDGGPAPETIDTFYEAAPWAEWMNVSHAPGGRYKGVKVPEVKVAFSSGVYGGTRGVPDPDKEHFYAWKPYNKYSERFGVFPRIGAPYTYLITTSRPACWVLQESYLTGGQRGPMRIGGEFWELTDKGGGKPWTFISKYSGSVPGVSQAVMYVLSPGPDGPLSTLRLETLYEGSQEGEARVFIEKALEAGQGKLAFPGSSSEETCRSLQEILDRRARMLRAYWPLIEWYPSSDWQARSAELYRAAAQVQAATGGK